jgi:Predicted transcriptional regulator
MTLSTEDHERIRQIIREELRVVVREELAAARREDDIYNDQAYLVATTTPQERNQMARQRRAAQVAAQKAAMKAAAKKTESGNADAGPGVDDTRTAASIPETGFLRLPEVLRLVPVSRATWYEGMTSGRYPKGVKLGARTIAWRAEDIRAIIKRLAD